VSYAQFVESNLDVRTREDEEFSCLCPYHADHNPSFRINVKSGLWICHACGERGNIEQLAKHMRTEVPVRKMELDDLRRSLRKLEAEPLQIRPESYLLRFTFVDPERYWESRGFTLDTIDEWQLGFDPVSGHHTIPIRDSHGRLLGVVRRRQNEIPKYLNPKGYRKSAHLFGSWRVTGDTVVLTEGQADTIMVAQEFGPSLAMMGDQLADAQVAILRRLGLRRIIVALDNDEAGNAATAKATIKLGQAGFLVSVIDWEGAPEGADPVSIRGSLEERLASMS
jgi:DNA primase